MNLNFNILGRRSGGAAQAFDQLGVIQAGFLSTTEIVCFTTKNGADSYNWYCYNEAGDTLIEAKLATTHQVIFTGLTINTTYTFKATASKSGFADSVPISIQETTFPYMPKFFYSIIGMPEPEEGVLIQENSFGRIESTYRITKIKSIIAVDSNLDLVPDSTTNLPSVVVEAGVKPYPRINSSAQAYYKPPVVTVLSGDVTFGWELIESSNVFRYMASHSNGNFQIRKGNNQDNWFVIVGGLAKVINYPSALPLNKVVKVLYQRRSTNPDKISNTATARLGFLLDDGTTTWGTDVTGVSSVDISIERWFKGIGNEPSQATWWTWFGVEKLLSDSEIVKSFDFHKMANYTLAAKYTGPLTIKGAQNWTSVPSNGEVADPKLDNAGTTTYARGQRLVVVGDDKAFICTHQNVTNNYADQIRPFNIYTNEIGDNLILPPHGYDLDLDGHNSSSIEEIDNTIMNVEAYHHNFNEPARNLYIRWLGPNFNITEYTEGIQAKGFAKISGAFQYVQIHKMGNVIVMIVQEAYMITPGGAKWLGCLTSYDRGNSWDYNRIIEQDPATGDWFYPNSAVTQSQTELMIVVDTVDISASNSRPYQFLIRYNPFTKVVSNLSGSYTKDVSIRTNAVSYAQLITNCNLTDGVYSFAGVQKRILSRAHWDGINGYAVGGNGDGTKYVLYQWTIAGGVTIQELDFGANPVDYSNLQSNADNTICVIRRGANSFLIVVRETIASKLQFVLYSTTDGGATALTRVEVLSQSATYNFARANINGGSDYTSKWLLNGIKKDGGGAGVGTYFIKDLSSYL